MGLDITAYRDIKKLDCVFDSGGEPIDPQTREPVSVDYFQANINPDFPGRASDLTEDGVYSFGDSIGFRAGSYSGYNQWRETLAMIAGYPAVDYERCGATSKRHDAGAWAAGSGPFFELINFSDCEGNIGAAVSGKLANDFAEFQAKADAHDDEYWRDKYAAWRKAFEMASNNGAVSFH